MPNPDSVSVLSCQRRVRAPGMHPPATNWEGAGKSLPPDSVTAWMVTLLALPAGAEASVQSTTKDWPVVPVAEL